MPPLDKFYIKIATAFVKYFTPIVIDEIKEYSEMEKEESRIAESLVYTLWQDVKRECFEQKTPLTKQLAINFFSSILNTEKSKEIWLDILEADHDFIYFNRMLADQQRKQAYHQAIIADDTAKQDDYNRQEWLRSLIRQTFIKTTHLMGADLTRFETNFDIELNLLINKLTTNNIPTNPEELKNLILEEIPSLKSVSFILDNINRKSETLSQIKPRRISRDEYVVPIDKKRLEKIEAVLDEEWAEIEAEIEKEEKMAEIQTIPTETLEIKELNYEATTTAPVFNVKEIEISPKGIKNALECIIFDYGAEEFYARIRSLLEQIKIYCRDINKLQDLLYISAALKKGYNKNFKKSVEILTKKAAETEANTTGLETKIKYIEAALSVLWASLSESIPTMGKINGNGN